jgi:hypothetical protein
MAQRGRPTVQVTLSENERGTLQRWFRRHSSSHLLRITENEHPRSPKMHKQPEPSVVFFTTIAQSLSTTSWSRSSVTATGSSQCGPRQRWCPVFADKVQVEQAAPVAGDMQSALNFSLAKSRVSARWADRRQRAHVRGRRPELYGRSGAPMPR